MTGHVSTRGSDADIRNVVKKCDTLLDLCVSSLRRGHANLLCIVPILTDDLRRGSDIMLITRAYRNNFIIIPRPKKKSLAPHSKHSCIHLFLLVFLSSNFYLFLSVQHRRTSKLPINGCVARSSVPCRGNKREALGKPSMHSPRSKIM